MTALRYWLGQHGQVFGARERAAVIRREICRVVSETPATDEVVLDFDGVRASGFSFADEVVAKLSLDLPGQRIVVANANEQILYPVAQMLRRRVLSATIENADGTRVEFARD
ncbi:MAG: DUF4325 domain-containing protein [Chloroflexota bacterium]|nr:MAG: DUF4325 domain-containing protein [Chloroflexota bacterium]